MTSLDIAIQISDLFEAVQAEGGLVAALIDQEIMPLVRKPLHEIDGIGLGDRFAGIIDKVRSQVQASGSDSIRNLSQMMKMTLAKYAKKTNDTITARHIYHKGIMGGGDTMLTVTAAGIMADLLDTKHATSLMQQIAGRLGGARVQEDASGAAVSAGAIATVPGKKKKLIRRQDSIFAEGDVVPFGNLDKPVENPDLADAHDVSNVYMYRRPKPPVPKPDVPQPHAPESFANDPAVIATDKAEKAGWKYVNVQSTPAGEIVIFQTPTRYGRGQYLNIYPGGLWEYGNRQGGPDSLDQFLNMHTKGLHQVFGEVPESLSWNDIQNLPATINLMEQIVRRNREQLVDGVIIDPTTAELVLSVHRAMLPHERQEYDAKPMAEMIEIAEQWVRDGLMSVIMEED